MKKGIKIILIVVIFLIVLVSIFAFVDYQMIKNAKEPIFCFYKSTLKDGGSKIYKGFGYTIINYYNPILEESKVRIGILHSPKDPFSADSRKLIVE